MTPHHDLKELKEPDRKLFSSAQLFVSAFLDLSFQSSNDPPRMNTITRDPERP